jgi:beta-glucosidase
MFYRLIGALLIGFVLYGQNGTAYKDPNAPLDKRVDDLLSRMTLEEKASQMLSDSPGIDRLGIPAYNWWNECLHGVARAGVATVFPEPIGLAATWDPDLIHRMATAISDEARAKHHEFVKKGKRGIYQGLTFWTPNINLFRDPRWGRGMETYGEDPYLTSRIAVQFIRGLQGDDPKYLKVVATSKHYAVHSGPESERHTFDARVSETDLWDTYLPHFEATIEEAGAQSVMCAYNAVDGLPACANPQLLSNILRNTWRFGGYVVSDCGAIGDIYQSHKAARTAEQGVAMAVKAGTDLDCGLEYEHLVAAVRQGLLSEKDLDTSVRRLLTARFRLGMFDPPSMVKYAQIAYSVNASKEHGELALETARKSIVLLKNEGKLLPLRKDLKTIGIIGPNANDIELLYGNYNGDALNPVTPLEGIRRKVAPATRVLYAQGSEVAAGVPVFETVPTASLVQTDGNSGKNGLRAEYFNTAAFNGRAYVGRAFVSPAMIRAVPIPQNPKPLFTRVDPVVDFNWRDAAPRADMKDDDFGVRWTGYLAPGVTGKYSLGISGMNAAELYLDGKQVAGFNNVHEKSTEFTTVDLEAGKRYAIRLDFHEVINDASIRLIWAPPHEPYLDKALEIARQSDVVIMTLGLSPRLEGEEMKVNVEGFSGGDRIRLGIPAVQEDLLKRVSALGKPVVLVLLNGSAVAVNWAKEHVPAIVELWYPGQAGGTALADILFGDYNPAGRLPVTFYNSEDQLPPFTDYDMKGRTYRFFEGEPLYPFGYGLSYTTFGYSDLVVPKQVAAGSDVNVTVAVENTGDRPGEEVVQAYIKRTSRSPGSPIRSLAGFERVALNAGEKKTVELKLSPRQLATVEAGGKRIVLPGAVEISIGGGQPGPSALSGTLEITGEPKTLE